MSQQVQNLDNLFAQKNVEAIKQMVDFYVQESVPLGDSKIVIAHLAKNLNKLDNTSCLAVAEHAINKLRTRQI